jgi:hypothetical protein
MIPRKEHLKQVNRFHDLVESIDKQIELARLSPTTDPDKVLKLLMQYFEITSKLWPIMDDKIEEIKNAIDKFEREKNE